MPSERAQYWLYSVSAMCSLYFWSSILISCVIRVMWLHTVLYSAAHSLKFSTLLKLTPWPSFFVLDQEPAGCYRCILWLWESQCQHSIHVLCWGCDDWGRRVCSSGHTVHENLENTKHRCIACLSVHIFIQDKRFSDCWWSCVKWNFNLCVIVLSLFIVYHRCRVMATWGQSQVHWRRSVWPCKHSYG